MKTRKPSSLAVLKNLPAERQAELWTRLNTGTDTSYVSAIKWLGEAGIKTGLSSLSDWFSWYPLQQQFREDAVTTAELIEQIKKESQGLTDEQLDDLGQRAFSLLAIRHKDLDGFVNVRSARTKAQLEKAKLKLRESKLAQDERRIALMERKAAAYDRAQELLTQAKTSKGGITRETLAKIESELRLL